MTAALNVDGLLDVLDSGPKAKATRLAFGETLLELGKSDSRVVALDADLSKSTRTDLFADEFPERFFNMGIAEANMIGVAAGLAGAGYIPYAASFGCFLSGRFDQIRMSVAFSDANVRLIGTHAGVAIGEDGHSQMALEDLALMRTLPGMTVLHPADETECRAMMQWSLTHKGPIYFRLTRQNLHPLKHRIDYSDGKKIHPGRWECWGEEKLSAADSILLIATGGLVENTIRAAAKIEEKGFKVAVANASWIKPYDVDFLSRVFKQPLKAIVTLEDHYVSGGLGSLVAEELSQTPKSMALHRIGVKDFGQSGKPADLYKHYGLDSDSITQQILSFL